MNRIENAEPGITDLKHKSCAALMLRCLDDSGITPAETAFGRLIQNAITLGYMPDDFRVIRTTLSDLGFFMQSTRLEGIRLSEVFRALAGKMRPAHVFVQVSDYMHLGGSMLAFRYDGRAFSPVTSQPEAANPESRQIVHVWIRWDDGADRSPYPRKTVHRPKNVSSRRKEPAETQWFKPFQPNPLGNSIGDCVVRGIAGALDISWASAVEKLAAMNEPTINAREVFRQLLIQEGFVHHKPLVRDGKRLKGKQFCLELNRIYLHGERIFAFVGRLHVAAVVPVESGDQGMTYKITDSWDSSERLIGDFWFKPAQEPSPREKEPRPRKETPATDLFLSQKVRHPAFGEGTIVGLEEKSSSTVLSIQFPDVGLKRLESRWVQEHCELER